MESNHFPTPVYFASPLTGFPLELVIAAWSQKKLYDWATGPRKKFDDIFSALDTIHEHDGRTDTGRQQRAVASRGKNVMWMSAWRHRCFCGNSVNCHSKHGAVINCQDSTLWGCEICKKKARDRWISGHEHLPSQTSYENRLETDRILRDPHACDNFGLRARFLPLSGTYCSY